MMELDFTKDEIETLKKYINNSYETINQLLVSNSETDIALLSDEVENKVVKIPYERESVIENLMDIKTLYKMFMKNYYKTKHKEEVFYRGTNLAEIERLKTEPFIDRIWAVTTDKKLEEEYASKWNRPVGIEITLDEGVSYIKLNEFFKSKKDKKAVLIAPFTKIKSIEEDTSVDLENSKYFKCYKIVVEKQELEILKDRERNGLYNYILENSYSINRRIEECIKLEKENAINFDNIRKMEQLLRVYENAIDEKEVDREYSDSDRTADYNDVERVTKELNDLKKISTNVFEIRKKNIDFINVWKRNIAVYMMAECKEIEKSFDGVEVPKSDEENIDNKEEQEDDSEEINNDENLNTSEDDLKNDESNLEEKDAEDIEKSAINNIDNDDNKDDNVIHVKINGEEIDLNEIDNSNEESADTKLDAKTDNDNEETKIVSLNSIEREESKVEDLNELHKRVRGESKDNVDSVQKLLDNINTLIGKQQNHARIAGNIGSTYSALTNAFEMRKQAEALMELVKKIDNKINMLCLKELDDRTELDLEIISKSNIEISTLLNYLNNPKFAIANSNINRFDEMAIIEENELKRGIAEKAREIRGEAELKKLKDDLEIIEEKGRFVRFIGLFTGRNKIDDFMIEQIEYRQMAIRKTLSKKLGLAYNYSIHEIIADNMMFINENEDDELIEDDVLDLKALVAELRKNYVILDSKVQSIIDEKEGLNLPYDNRKMTKKEIIEVETYRFLHKYNYDISDDVKEEPKYQDTVSTEISRIVEYINSSKIL